MKVKSFLLSVLLAVGSTVVVASEAEVKAEISLRGQMVNQAEQFVERTVNMIATPFISDKDVECLARNIFYESGGEPTEGKIAVGMVTVNRALDPRYPQSVCGVVKQKTVLTVPQNTTIIKTVPSGLFGTPQQVTETKTTMVQKIVCQFSWNCMKVKAINKDDPRWIESQEVAEIIARGGYEKYQAKYGNAMHFHAVHVNPGWKLKRIGRTGNHIFYE